MRIEDLKIFVDVVKYHSMNIAAEKNFTTPQNLSKIIKRMENELGVVLFKRSKKGSDLTKNGEYFYLRIIDVLNDYEAALIALSGHACSKTISSDISNLEHRKLRVLCTQGVLSYILYDSYTKLQDDDLKYILEEDEINFSDPDQIVSYINDRQYDLIVCYIQQEEIDAFVSKMKDYTLMHVIMDEMVLVAAKENPITRRSQINISEISNLDIIQTAKNMDEIPYKVMTNSFEKALELLQTSTSNCTMLCKHFFSRIDGLKKLNDNLEMVRIEPKKYLSYVVLLNRNCMSDNYMIELVKKIMDAFLDGSEMALLNE